MDLPVSHKLAAIVEYEGTEYRGFQRQVGLPTVQAEIEDALMKVTGERIRVVGAGRTDAGVHARGQVVSFMTFSSLASETMGRALNYYLPRDINIREVREVSDSFNARREAVRREYRYTIFNSPTPSPFSRKYSWHVPRRLDVEAMDRACRPLLGRHDFASFTVPFNGSTVRRITRAEVSRKSNMVILDIAADSFLPHQVRRMMGSLVEVGLGKLDAGSIAGMLEANKPGLAAFAAPALGLCLMRVVYREQKLGEGQEDENL